MHTYTQILYQIVFCPKDRKSIMIEKNRPEMFRFMWGVMNNLNCKLYRINGIEDHLHIIVSIHPAISLANFVKTIKTSSSRMIKEKKLFPYFSGWQVGYGAFTYSYKDKDRLINYVKRQKEHHQKKNFIDEYKGLLKEHGIDYDERFIL